MCSVCTYIHRCKTISYSTIYSIKTDIDLNQLHKKEGMVNQSKVIAIRAAAESREVELFSAVISGRYYPFYPGYLSICWVHHNHEPR